MMKRDGVGEDAARRRMAAQLVNEEYVLHANVIFSTQWEPEYTQKQVQSAHKHTCVMEIFSSGTSDRGPSEKRTASLETTVRNVPNLIHF